MKVIIVGRINVGKSTLFNRLIEEKKSIVSCEPGTTRDRIYGTCFWRGKSFQLVDLAGLKKIKGEKDLLEKEIQKQIIFALEEGDLIIFLLDGKIGLTPEDKEIAKRLKKLKKPVILTINKIDSPKQREKIKEENFLSLGFGKPILISAANGSGTGDLLDEIIKKMEKIKQNKKEEIKKETIRVAIIGKTNVGKSTLINSILNQERVIVTPLPHTTREPVDTFLEYKNKTLILIDTAGIRRRTKIKKEIERIGVEKSLKMIKRAEIVLLVFDLVEKISHLERTLAGLVKKEKRGVILVINKFDLAKFKIEEYLKYYQNELSTLWWAPIIFISAKEKINLNKLLDLILEVKERMEMKFNQKELTKILKMVIKKYSFKEKFWQKTEIFQEKKKFPTIIIKVPHLTRKEKPPTQAQLNILEKKIREKLNLWGVPLELSAKIKM